jgi:ribosomal protein L14
VIQPRTKLRLRDPGGWFSAKALRTARRGSHIGDVITIATVGRRRDTRRRDPTDPSSSGGLARALILRTRGSVMRYDGSTYRGCENGCVSLTRSGSRYALGFRRLAGSLPYELRRPRDAGLRTTNAVRLARAGF